MYSCGDDLGSGFFDSGASGVNPGYRNYENGKGNKGNNGNNNANNPIGKYNEFLENPFISTKENPVSTFSVDADGGSFAHVRGYINQGIKPPKFSVRVEEFINYFPMDYQDDGANSISLNGEVCYCPWDINHKLIRIGIKGREIAEADYPYANFVLLIDVSGSMGTQGKLDYIKEGFIKFVDKMRPQDRLAIVTYAGTSGVLMESTPGTKKEYIKKQIRKLKSGGSTHGSSGIIKAYQIAEENFIEGGNNRVILGTDGDFNVGITSQDELIKLIEEKRKSGIFLTTIGVGLYVNEGMLEQLANKGNGNYEFIDRVEEMEKVFINDYNKFLTVAKDVKVQVEFNPNTVEKYRLIGYVNRLLKNEDFDNDTIDAGEIGAGQTITALYEIIPINIVDTRALSAFSVDFRYKEPDENTSKKLHLDVLNNNTPFENASDNMIFAAAAASYGMILFDSKYKGKTSMDKVSSWVKKSSNFDPHGYRQDFLKLIETSKSFE